MKKVLSILLLVTIGVTLLAAPAIAKEGSESNQNQNQNQSQYQNQNQNQNQSQSQNQYQNQHQNQGEGDHLLHQNQYGYQYHYKNGHSYHGTYGIYLYQKDSDWNPVNTDVYGHIQWSAGGFAFNGYNLDIQEYTLLIYWSDEDQPGWVYEIVTILGNGTPIDYGDGESYLAIEGNTNIYDYSGLKIWLVPSSDLNLTGDEFIIWDPYYNYLFENELIP